MPSTNTAVSIEGFRNECEPDECIGQAEKRRQKAIFKKFLRPVVWSRFGFGVSLKSCSVSKVFA